MSSFLVLKEWDNRNRWRDGQKIMAPWARRPGSVLVCYAQIGRGRPRETFVACQYEGTRDVLWTYPWCLKGFFSGDEKRGALLWMEEKNPALDQEN
ncbi:hypothetical protein TNCV_2795361 [Trichonephila clavipes]|nr:hypothetical protein TNCV_2795361 [Trichonephila clavipes]